METVKRGRGRPKGSKNKVKKDKAVEAVVEVDTKDVSQDKDQGGPDSKEGNC